MSATLKSLDSRLGRLSLHSPPTQLVDELEEIGFEIFRPVCSLGFFTWRPPKTIRYQKLSDIQASDIEECLDMNGSPKTLTIPEIRMPYSFGHSTGREIKFMNKFPYGQLECVHLHAATRRDVDWSTTDFCVGGSVLNMLADRDTTDSYFCCKVPHTNGCILIAKRKEYIVDFGEVGHQFERLVTAGADPSEASGIDFTEHLQIMQVSKFSVLFRADVDALSAKTGLPIEIKASNPRYWGKKVMLQMISSGSTTLCEGSKHRGTLVSIKTRSLSNVARDAVDGKSDIRQIETNIEEGLSAIKKQLESVDDGEVYKVTFAGSMMTLAKVRTRAASDFLPDSDVMKTLLTKST